MDDYDAVDNSDEDDSIGHDSSASASLDTDEEEASLDMDELNDALRTVVYDASYESRQQQDFCETLCLVEQPQQQRDEAAREHVHQLQGGLTDEQLHSIWRDMPRQQHQPLQQRRGKHLSSEHQKRCDDAVRFCSEVVTDVRLTKYERDHMRCEPEYFREARRRALGDQVQQCGGNRPTTVPPPLSYRPQPLTADEKKKKVFTVRYKEQKMLFIIENYVHVTYFVNALTGDLCKFSLCDLGTKLLDYYVEYSCKKFAKVNLRLHDGLSFLLYTSSVLVETGSDNQVLSRRLLQYVVALLRERCGYPHINIKRRKCQNIVVTGKLSYDICMNVLKHKFPAAREKEGFAGLVIKHRDLVKFFQTRDNGDTGYECVATDAYQDEDDDSDVIAQINQVNDCRQMTQQVAKQTKGTTIINEYGEEEDEEAAFQRITKLTDEHDPRSSQALNGTDIVFGAGQFISTGCKTDAELVSMMPLLMRLTLMCSESSAENRRMEAALVAQKKQQKQHPGEQGL